MVVFLRVLWFSPTFNERSARYKWNILERAVKPKSKKKKHHTLVYFPNSTALVPYFKGVGKSLKYFEQDVQILFWVFAIYTFQPLQIYFMDRYENYLYISLKLTSYLKFCINCSKVEVLQIYSLNMIKFLHNKNRHFTFFNSKVDIFLISPQSNMFSWRKIFIWYPLLSKLVCVLFFQMVDWLSWFNVPDDTVKVMWPQPASQYT